MRRVKSLKRLLKKETNSPQKLQKSCFSVTANINKILAVHPGYKIDQVKAIRSLGITLKRLRIVPYSESELETLRMYGQFGNVAGFYREIHNRTVFPLIESKNYVERLYKNGILPEGTHEQQQ